MVGAISRIRNIGPGEISGDRALLALTVRDVWSHPVLVGPYSRFFWHHPGPLYFYLLALPNLLSGGQTLGLVLGAALINALAAAGVVYLAFRRGGPALAVWTSLLLGVYLAALGPAAFDLWNPSATVIPFALVLMLSWSVACLDIWSAPWLVLASSFCIQSHVGLVPGVLASCAVATVAVVARRRRDEHFARAARPALVVAAALGLVLWLPPLIDQLSSAPGNLTLLVQFFSRSGSQHDLAAGLTNTAFQMTLVPRALLQHGQLTDLEAHTRFGFEFALSTVAFLAGLALAIRVKATDAVVLFVLVAVELGIAVYSVTRIVGNVDYYLVEWISAVGLMVWVASGAGVIAWIAAHAHLPRSRRLQIISAIGLCVVAVGIAISASSNTTVGREAYADPSQRVLVDGILASSHHSRHVVLALGDQSAWPALAGTALTLEQRGVDVKIVRSNVTALLFDEGYLTDPHPAGFPSFVVDTTQHSGPENPAARVVARAGRWSIEQSD